MLSDFSIPMMSRISKEVILAEHKLLLGQGIESLDAEGQLGAFVVVGDDVASGVLWTVWTRDNS
jgi:hypothetical protein